ncbi:hypothetical protein EZJ43_07995 [Pedobacter changchengzhani]|uniref:Uncharacterized protein n=1 Tax=Pedobacter changchengzhani TaxID=2529274 RepID=A0A4R5ML79_9SPHI|nr:hypothetical protein [Pedobacter changchengzhani]TDG36450.1 hypothetical protein EZJ43_07995 [Pedobacter changchengzhani]
MKNIVLILMVSLSLQSCGQEKETYWQIASVYRPDEKPIKGMKEFYLDQIFQKNFNFRKRNDSLFFELPQKFKVSLKNFKSLSQLNIDEEEYFKMENHEFAGDKFLIKFKDNTLTDPKNGIIEFKQISKEDFEKNIAKDVAHKQEVARKMNALKSELAKQSPIILNAVKKLPLKTVKISNDKSDHEIALLIPEEIELKETGSVNNEQFGKILVGTFQKNSKIYDLVYPNIDYGLKQVSVWFSTDPTPFNIENYYSENPNMFIVKKEKNNIVGYTIRYDEDSEQAVVQSFFTLKYFKSGNSHIFIFADVNRRQTKNYPNAEEMNKIINFNYLMSENISLK